jgi:hypothetical protein
MILEGTTTAAPTMRNSSTSLLAIYDTAYWLLETNNIRMDAVWSNVQTGGLQR